MALFAMIVTFIALGTLLAVEKNYRSRYPVPEVYSDIKAIWEEQTSAPMKYVGGYIEWTLPLVIYNQKDNLNCLSDTLHPGLTKKISEILVHFLLTELRKSLILM